MFIHARKWKLGGFGGERKLLSARGSAVLCGMLLAASAAAGFFCCVARAQRGDAATRVLVHPGAPGKPSKTLPPTTKGAPPQWSQADVKFMQGMIMHHEQAVEMTALIASHTENKDVRSLGARISSSQSDEIKFMQRWLAARGEAVSMAMPAGMSGMDTSSHSSAPMAMALMPGMLAAEQMEGLGKGKGGGVGALFL